MVKFIPVRYQSFNYPEDDDIHPQIQEVTCNLGTERLEGKTCLDYLSLHTDPSIVWDKWPKKKEKIRNSMILSEFPTIFNNFRRMIDSGQDCISMLWSNDKWSKEFAGFLVRLTEIEKVNPQRIKIIEIHSPFDTHCKNLETFLERYAIFENEIIKKFPSANIVIENQYTHKGKKRFGNFSLSNAEDIKRLSKLISDSEVRLRLVLDIPQLLSAYYDNKVLSKDEIKAVLDPIIDSDIRNNIKATHIWGYDNSKTRGAHSADLNTYFNNNLGTKICFLEKIHDLFNDGEERYFVPEVGSSKAIESIVKDLRREAGVKFVRVVDPS